MKKLIIPLVGLVAVACSSGSGTDSTTTTTGTTEPATTTGTAAPATTGATAAAGGAKFSDVASIASANCMPCHSAEKHRAGLNLTSYADIMKGGEHGPGVKAGDPDNSVIVKAISGGDPAQKIPKMPPQKTLSADDIQKIKDWIKAGAKEA